jgi:hypothetical protein
VDPARQADALPDIGLSQLGAVMAAVTVHFQGFRSKGLWLGERTGALP